MDKIVVYTGTRNVYKAMETAAKSLLASTPVDHVYFMIEDDVYPDALPDIITTMHLPEQNWFDSSGPNYHSSWTYMAFLRLAFAKVFPQYDQVLYLDSDTIVLRDITSMLELSLGQNLFGMVQEDINEIPLEIMHSFAVVPDGLVKFQSDEPRPEFCIRPYYNSGVMLMNLHQLRVTGKDDSLIRHLNTTLHQYPDQDTINLLCHDMILSLPPEYNVIPALFPDFPQHKIRIRHFASDKPLWKSSLWQSFRRMSWDDVIARQISLKGGQSQ